MVLIHRGLYPLFRALLELVSASLNTQSPEIYRTVCLWQFHMDLYYPPTAGTGKSAFIVTIQGSILSCLPAQQRFLIRGTKGSYIKHGVDPQESFLKKVGSSNEMRGDWGVESEDAWGTLFEARPAGEGEKSVKNTDGTEFVSSKWVQFPRSRCAA